MLYSFIYFIYIFHNRVTHAESGRTLDVYTNQPGVQFYTGNFLDGIAGKDGAAYRKHSGFCLETQNYPNAPNEARLTHTFHFSLC